jgi:ankyrin repeat protein
MDEIFNKLKQDDISLLSEIHPNDNLKILTLAIIEDSPKIVSEMVKNMPLDDFFNQDDGHTLLMSAIGKKALKVAQVLLELGCSPNIKNEEGLSALKIACLTQNLEAVKLLDKYQVKYEEDILRVGFVYAKKADLAIHLLNNGASYSMYLDLLKKKNKKEKDRYLELFEVQGAEHFFDLMEKIHEKNRIEKKMKTIPSNKLTNKIKI